MTDTTAPKATASDPRPCPVCLRDAADVILLFEDGGWRVVRCAGCDMVFLANPPTYEALAAEHGWTRSFEAEHDKRITREPVLHAIQTILGPLRKRTRPNKLRRLFRAHFVGRTIIDLGCGTGQRFFKGLDGKDMRIIPLGIEIEPDAAAKANAAFERLGGRAWAGPVCRILGQQQPCSAQGALLYTYLEHETQPGPVLEQLHRVLAPDAPVIIKVPNHDCLNRRVRGRRWCGYRLPDHVNYFTPRSLRDLLQRHGYRVIRHHWRDHGLFNDNTWMVARRDSA